MVGLHQMTVCVDCEVLRQKCSPTIRFGWNNTRSTSTSTDTELVCELAGLSQAECNGERRLAQDAWACCPRQFAHLSLPLQMCLGELECINNQGGDGVWQQSLCAVLIVC